VEDGIGEETTAKKGNHFPRQWLKRLSDFFKKKYWHPLVAAPCDTNPSDATSELSSRRSVQLPVHFTMAWFSVERCKSVFLGTEVSHFGNIEH